MNKINYKIFLITVLFIVLLTGFSSAISWIPDSNINKSLINGAFTMTEVFFKDNSWELIAAGTTSLAGWVWNGTDWISNSTIITGLGSTDDNYITVFFKDNSWYYISGNGANTFVGYTWNGTQWVSNSTIINGLTGINDACSSTPVVFNINNDWYLLTGSFGGYIGWSWNGTDWISNSSIINNLGASGFCASPEIFYKNSVISLFAGSSNFNLDSYTWNGTQWVSNSTIATGISEYGRWQHPEPFQKDGIWYVIFTDENTGNKGFIDNDSIPPLQQPASRGGGAVFSTCYTIYNSDCITISLYDCSGYYQTQLECLQALNKSQPNTFSALGINSTSIGKGIENIKNLGEKIYPSNYIVGLLILAGGIFLLFKLIKNKK